MRSLRHTRFLRTSEYLISIMAGAVFAAAVVMVMAALVMRYGAQAPVLTAVARALCNIRVVADAQFAGVAEINLGLSLVSAQSLILWIFATGCCLLLLRTRIIGRERAAIAARLLPEPPGTAIHPDDVPALLAKLAAYEGTIVATLVERSLHQYECASVPAETTIYASASAEVLASQIGPQYAFLMVCTYAIPMVGLLGTLLGFQRVVNWLSAPDADLSVAVLGTSFDAALVAVVATFLLFFFITMTQAAEEDMVAAAHDYCLAHLPNRLVPTDAVEAGRA